MTSIQAGRICRTLPSCSRAVNGAYFVVTGNWSLRHWTIPPFSTATLLAPIFIILIAAGTAVGTAFADQQQFLVPELQYFRIGFGQAGGRQITGIHDVSPC